MKRKEVLTKLTSNIVCIDSHSHCGGIDMYNYQHGRLHMTQNMRDLTLKMSQAHIDFFIVYPMVSTTYLDSRDFSVTGIDEFPYELSNKALLYETQLFGYNALPFLAIHPNLNVNEQLIMLEQKVSEGTVFGLKFHPLATHSTVEDLINSDFANFLYANSLPITVHSSDFDEYSDPKLVFRFIESHPDIKINIAHCGYFDKEFYKQANNYDNLFIDSSSFNVLCQIFERRTGENEKLSLNWKEPIQALLELYHLVPNKLMWGTDEPWTCYTDYKGKLIAKGDIFTEKNLLDGLQKKIKEKITYHNTLKFLGG